MRFVYDDFSTRDAKQVTLGRYMDEVLEGSGVIVATAPDARYRRGIADGGYDVKLDGLRTCGDVLRSFINDVGRTPADQLRFTSEEEGSFTVNTRDRLYTFDEDVYDNVCEVIDNVGTVKGWSLDDFKGESRSFEDTSYVSPIRLYEDGPEVVHQCIGLFPDEHSMLEHTTKDFVVRDFKDEMVHANGWYFDTSIIHLDFPEQVILVPTYEGGLTLDRGPEDDEQYFDEIDARPIDVQLNGDDDEDPYQFELQRDDSGDDMPDDDEDENPWHKPDLLPNPEPSRLDPDEPDYAPIRWKQDDEDYSEVPWYETFPRDVPPIEITLNDDKEDDDMSMSL